MVMMQEELDKERASSAMRSSERDKTKAALEKEENAHKETKRTLEEMRSQHEAMMAESAENYRKEIEDIKKELDIEKARCAELRSEVFEAKTAFEKEQSKNEGKQREIKELEIKKGNLEAESKAEIKRLSGENNSFKEKIKSLKGELKNLRKQSKKEMEQLKTEQETKLDAKEQEVTELTKQLKIQESQIKNVSEEIAKLNNDYEHLRKASDEEKKKLNETEEKLRAEAKAKGDALNELAKLREGSGRVFHYKNDSDKYGVIFWLGSNFRTAAWENPSEKRDPATKVIASRSSDKVGLASDLLNHTKTKRKISCTEDMKKSWWWVALSAKYLLYLTHYTLRHGGDNDKAFLRNWKLEGSIDGSDCNWKVLKKHDNDWTLEKSPSHIATWSIEGEVGAFRFFKIVQTGKNSSKDHGIYLSGIELYGILIEGPNN